MKFKNFSVYVQKQTNFMLKNFRDFVKTYINDIVFFFISLNEHVKHLDKDFQRLLKYDVTLNLKKFFLKYSFIMLLKQIVNVFEMIIFEKKIDCDRQIIFFKNVQESENISEND